jgi:hypothetical protein
VQCGEQQLELVDVVVDQSVQHGVAARKDNMQELTEDVCVDL